MKLCRRKSPTLPAESPSNITRRRLQMAQTRTLQRRLRSVRNAKQITKALEVVAASRMRRVVSLVEGSRTYGELAAAVMAKISANPEAHNLPYFSPDAGKPPLYVVITSDRGQAGAF